MWKKTKEMKWKTAKLLWGDLFYDIAGAVLVAAGFLFWLRFRYRLQQLMKK